MSGVTRDPGIDALKGLLITLIILGHNYFYSRYWPFAFSLLYNFHVACFLLLPFLFPLNRIGVQGLRDRMLRALAPQAIFLIAAMAAYFVLFVVKDWHGIAGWLGGVAVGLVFQTEQLLENASGFRHFWFLPAMASLLGLLWVYDHAGRGVRMAILATALLWHVSIGFLKAPEIQYLPWGIAIVGFVFLPGLLVRQLDRQIRWTGLLDVVVVALWVLMLWVCVRNRWSMGLAGDIVRVKTWMEPGRLLFHDGLLVLSFFSLKRIAARIGGAILPALGRVSLSLFLMIPLLWQVFWMAGGSRLDAQTIPGRVLLVVGTLLFMLATGYGLARWIECTRLKALLFPRDLGQWRGAWVGLIRRGN